MAPLTWVLLRECDREGQSDQAGGTDHMGLLRVAYQLPTKKVSILYVVLPMAYGERIALFTVSQGDTHSISIMVTCAP